MKGGVMDRAEKIHLLKGMLKQVAPGNDLEALEEKHAQFHEGLGREQLPEESVAADGLRKLAEGDEEAVTDQELEGLEAIILLRERPVALIRPSKNGGPADYDTLPDPWDRLNRGADKKRVVGLLPAVGRIEVPNSPRIPYGGTGFVVGEDLIMTNRHVARLFAEGVGERRLSYRFGDAEIDFHREVGTPSKASDQHVGIREVVMIHPYWDMALLRVDRLPNGVSPLKLSVEEPEALNDREVVVIGYPARDDRNDLEVQDRIFDRIYMVKRLQPGRVRARQSVTSFGNQVNALTHDSSTLGGNSGSAVIDLKDGRVLALHFAGEYLKANYAVPTYELARDTQIVARRLNFVGQVPATADWKFAWDRLEGEGPVSSIQSTPQATARASTNSVTWTIPLQVSVSISVPAPLSGTPGLSPGPTGVASAPVEAPRMAVPIIHDGLDQRSGFRSDFLGSGDVIGLLPLTKVGKRAAARLEDGTWELRYHKFSIVMHKDRRMAMFTASNVDWREEKRLIDGRKPPRRELTGLPEGTAEQWVTDPRILGTHQLPDVFFTKDRGAFDKGHLVRRDDVCWGDTFDDMQKANGDTFHTTNCTPQVAGFNRPDNGEDNWGDLEKLVESGTKAERAIVFSGPVLSQDDPEFEGRDAHGTLRVKIPRAYWKIVVVKGADGPEVFGFLLEQDLSHVPAPEELIVPDKWKRHMRSVAEIEGRLGGLLDLTDLKAYDQQGTETARAITESLRRS
jgi:endonuclease G